MGVISAIGGIASAVIGARSARKSAEAANTGFDYLRNNPVVQATQGQAVGAQNAINTAMGLNGAIDFEDSLAYDRLLAGPQFSTSLDINEVGVENLNFDDMSFDNFRESTGYDFRFGEGQRAITGSAAARGLLGSGATAKGLTQFGQNIASDEYDRFIAQTMARRGQEMQRHQQMFGQRATAGQQLFGQQFAARQLEGSEYGQQQAGFLNFMQGLEQQQQTGLDAAYNVASQGASAGQDRVGYIQQGGREVASGLGMAVGGLSDAYTSGSWPFKSS